MGTWRRKLGVVLAPAGIAASSLHGCRCSGTCDPFHTPTRCEGDVLVFCSVPSHSVLGNLHRRDCQDDGKLCFEKDGNATCVTDKEPCDPVTTKATCDGGRPTTCRESIAGLHHLQAKDDCRKEGMTCVVSPKGWAGCVGA